MTERDPEDMIRDVPRYSAPEKAKNIHKIMIQGAIFVSIYKYIKTKIMRML